MPSTAGSSVSAAARTKATESMMPSAIDRNAGLGTSMTAESEISTVSSGEEHRLAGGVHRHRRRLVGERLRPKSAPRNRTTMNRA